MHHPKCTSYTELDLAVLGLHGLNSMRVGKVVTESASSANERASAPVAVIVHLNPSTRVNSELSKVLQR